MNSIQPKRKPGRPRLYTSGTDSKVCHTCHKTLPFSAFHRDKSRHGGVRDVCKQCIKDYHAANSVRFTQVSREWQKANPSKVHGYKKKFYNLNYSSKAGKQPQSDTHLRKFKSMRSRASVHQKNRNAKKRGAGGSYTFSEWRDLCDRYGNVCLACGRSGRLTADHIIPVVKGGSSDISNIQPLCAWCNSKKGTQTIDYRPEGLLRVLDYVQRGEA